MVKEMWVDVFNFEKCYQVSNTGKMRSKTRTHRSRNKWGEFDRTIKGKELKLNKNPNGYFVIELYDMGRFAKRGVHVVVWESFNGKGLPCGHVVHHKNEDKTDNSINNLKLMSYVEHNQYHSHEPWNKGKKMPKKITRKAIFARTKGQLAKAEECYYLKNKGFSTKEIAEEIGVGNRQVYTLLKKRLYYSNYLKERTEQYE